MNQKASTACPEPAVDSTAKYVSSTFSLSFF